MSYGKLTELCNCCICSKQCVVRMFELQCEVILRCTLSLTLPWLGPWPWPWAWLSRLRCACCACGLTSRRLSTKIHNLPQLTARRHRLRSMFAELTHILHRNAQLCVRQFYEHTGLLRNRCLLAVSCDKLWIFVESRLKSYRTVSVHFGRGR